MAAEIENAEMNKLSNEFQNRLVRTISHEIKTPLNAIQGSIEILEQTLDPQILKGNDLYFRTMKNAIRFLIYFVEGIFKLSRFYPLNLLFHLNCSKFQK